MLTLNQKSYLCDFLKKFVPQEYGLLWDLAGQIDDKEYRYLIALCFDAQRNGKVELLKSEVDSKIKKYANVQQTK